MSNDEKILALKKRIKKTLEFEIPDRIGVADDFAENVIRKWKEDGSIPREVKPEEPSPLERRLRNARPDVPRGDTDP